MPWLVLAFLSAISAAFVAIFGKIGLSSVDSTVATALRSIVMMIALTLTTVFIGKLPQMFQVNSRDWVFIILSGLAGAASWIFYFAALKLGPAGKIASIDRLSLIFVIFLAALFLGEKLTVKSFIGAVLMTAGALLIVLK